MRPGYLLTLPLTDYPSALALQHDCVSARRSGSLQRDLIIFLEHPPVFTLGRRGGRDNLLIPESTLKARNIAVIPAERGGDITYHGPGQLVAYLIIDLKQAGLSVTELVDRLETIMIRTVAHWQVTAEGNRKHRGVWTQNGKLGSIGLTIRRGISFHGLALNVNTDLAPFRWINPCGIEGCAMTSLAQETGGPVPMEAVRKQMADQLDTQLGLTLAATTIGTIQSSLIHAANPIGGMD